MDNVNLGRCFGCGGSALQRIKSISRFRSLINMSPSRFSHVFCLGLLENFANYSSATEEFSTRIQLSELTETDIVPKDKCCFRYVEQILAQEKSDTWSFPSLLGNAEFNDLMIKQLLGEDSPAVLEKRVFSIQTPGCTGALRVAAEFLRRCCDMKTFFIPESTSFNYEAIFIRAGFQHTHVYRYYDAATHELNFDLMKADLEDAVERSVVILQVSAPYPYGINLLDEQWVELAEIAKEKKLLLLFDATGVGLTSGKIEKDSWPIRFFTEQGLEFFCVCSFSKNLGICTKQYSLVELKERIINSKQLLNFDTAVVLTNWQLLEYNCFGCPKISINSKDERIGNMLVVIKDPELLQQVISHVAVIIKSLFSIPPAHGATAMTAILKNPELKEEMNKIMKDNTNFLNEKRRLLYWKLKELRTPGQWEFLVKQDGLFIYLGFTEPQIEYMRRVHNFTLKHFGGIYLVSLAGATITDLAKAIHSTVTRISDQRSDDTETKPTNKDIAYYLQS